jgi:uncharacterized membrane protein (Fun14 family)
MNTQSEEKYGTSSSILAVIVGIFFAGLMNLESQNIISINWDKLQAISQSRLIANSISR